MSERAVAIRAVQAFAAVTAIWLVVFLVGYGAVAFVQDIL